jgi:hypothetical protein
MVNFSNLKLNPSTGKETIKIGDYEISVSRYLPIQEKMNLIDITLQESYRLGMFHPVLLQTMFYVNLVSKYTDIVFSEEDRLHYDDLYDTLTISGVIREVIAAIPQSEYENLLELLEDSERKMIERNNSIASGLQVFLEQLPVKMKETVEVLKDFDPEKFKEVMEFSKAANGGRPIE